MKRYEEIDFARALPLLFLPLVHCYEQFADYGAMTASAVEAGRFALFLCALGPSIFMPILGMNIAFSSHTSPKELTRRGLITILIFYAHNFVRFFIPALVCDIATEEEFLSVGLASMTMSDILFFAGLAFLFFALMKKWNVSPTAIIVITLVMLSIHTLIVPENMESNIFTEFVGCFVHVTHYSAFPAMSWMLYPALGYALGLKMKELQTEEELRSFYNKLGALSLSALAALCVCMYSYGLDFLLISASPANDYTTDLFNIALDTAIGGVWLWMTYHVYNTIKRQAPARFVTATNKLSKAIMVFYIVQWVIVGWMMLVFGALGYYMSNAFGLGFIISISVLVMIVSLLISLPIQKKLDAKKAGIRSEALYSF